MKVEAKALVTYVCYLTEEDEKRFDYTQKNKTYH